MRVNEAIEPNDDQEHKPGFPCPKCDVITIRQPWASLIALGFKHDEFFSRRYHLKGSVVIHSSKTWVAPALRKLLLIHFNKYGLHAEEAVLALFPVQRPVADAVVKNCEQWTNDPAIKEKFALSLTQVRIIPRPKPVFDEMKGVVWRADRLPIHKMQELANALARTRVLEGREKDRVYEEFGLLALHQKINGWLRGEGLAHLQLTPPN